MAAIQRIIFLAFMAASLLHVASAIAGQATINTSPVPSACYGSADQGTMIAAASAAIFNNGGGCGTRYQIKCTGPTNTRGGCHGGVVTVTIVDLCPSCPGNQFDLSQEAFSIIADPNAVIVNIDYVQV